MKRTVLVGLAVFLVAAPLLGQDPTTGFPPYGSFRDGRFDAVNHQNLNVNFAVPITSSPGRGTGFGFAIVYDSLVWKKVTTGQTTSWSPVTDATGTAIWGWKRSSPIGMITYKVTTTTVKCFPPNEPSYWSTNTIYNNYVYYDAAGTSHPFSVSRTYSECYDTWSGTATGFATNGSGYYIDITITTNPLVRSTAGTSVRIGSLTDTNGNYISKIVVSSSETHWKDTLGRIALKVITTSSYVDYQFLDATGTYQTTRLNLQTFNIKTNFQCSGVVEHTSSASLPVSVVLPNGRSYSLTYEDTPGFSGYVTGRVKRVTLPTGGFYEYQYPATPNNGIECTDASVVNLTRVISDGQTPQATWTFTRAFVSPNWKTVVTAPVYESAANQSTFTFNSSKQLTNQKIYQGSEGGTALREIITTWAANGTPSSTTIKLEDGSKQSKTDTTFDTYGNLQTLREYDWGTGAPGAAIRTTSVTYETGASYTNLNIRNLVKQVLVQEGSSGPIKARTNVTYDSTALTCVTGAPQHDDTGYGCSFTTRGNPTVVTRYADAAGSSGAQTTQLVYDSLGNLRTST
ncbi:MAG: hypothetical protein L0338_05145, partial [Acidobacteria bacterium]|nr:hypothetical protein [Acidobacteriota bacterium]